MNYAYLHLVLVHIPVIGAIFGTLLLVLAIARNNGELKRVSLGVFVVIAVIAIPVYFTGEPAEELVENLPGVSESIIDQHEEAGLVSLVVIEILGAISLGGLFLFHRSKHIPRLFVMTTLILSIGSGGLMGWAANLGGKIRHTEIRSALKSSTHIDNKTMNLQEGWEKERRRKKKDHENDDDDD